MTSVIDNIADELIRRVKEQTAASEFAFNMAYPPRRIAHPLKKYLVTVQDRGAKPEAGFIGGRVGEGLRGALYEAEISLRVYAPAGTSGAALLRASSLLADAAERADQGRLIRGIELSGIAYDDSARTLYRDIALSLSMALSEEVDDD